MPKLSMSCDLWETVSLKRKRKHMDVEKVVLFSSGDFITGVIPPVVYAVREETLS